MHRFWGGYSPSNWVVRWSPPTPKSILPLIYSWLDPWQKQSIGQIFFIHFETITEWIYLGGGVNLFAPLKRPMVSAIRHHRCKTRFLPFYLLHRRFLTFFLFLEGFLFASWPEFLILINLLNS